MKRLIYLASFLSAALLISSCGGLNKMKENASEVNYKVTPEILETHGGKVAVTIDVTYPEKYFNKKAILTATPTLTYEGGETTYESVTVQGEKVEDNYKVISWDGGSFNYQGEIDYDPAMLRSELMIVAEASAGNNSVTMDPYKIADGVIATPTLVLMDPKPVMVGDKFQRIVPKEYMADIHYVINRSTVRNSELRKEDVQGMGDFMKKTKENERMEMRGITVSAYASPDGPLDFNEKLSEDRQKSAKRYLDRELRRSRIDVPKDEELFELMSTAEDWEGFKELVQNSDIPDKELILRVLSMYSDPAVREKEIRNLSEAFEVLKDEILPELRRSKMIFNAEKIGWSDEEIQEFIESDPDTLNMEEMLYAATLYDDMAKKRDIYKKTFEGYPECFRAINNVGYVSVMLGDLDAAEDAFLKAKELKENDVVKNNLGVIALMKDDIETAENLFTSATEVGDAANYNLGIIKIMQGEYEAAESYFGTTVSFNSALAKTMLEKYPGAKSILSNMPDKSAKAHYLSAVIAAREGDDEAVFSALREAVAKDSKWKDYAGKDLEFFRYFEEDSFKSIVE